MWLIAALAIGVTLGVVVQRGDFCMHSAFRELVAARPGRMLHAYLLALGAQLVVVNALAALGWLVTLFPPPGVVAHARGRSP